MGFFSNYLKIRNKVYIFKCHKNNFCLFIINKYFFFIFTNLFKGIFSMIHSILYQKFNLFKFFVCSFLNKNSISKFMFPIDIFLLNSLRIENFDQLAGHLMKTLNAFMVNYTIVWL